MDSFNKWASPIILAVIFSYNATCLWQCHSTYITCNKFNCDVMNLTLITNMLLQCNCGVKAISIRPRHVEHKHSKTGYKTNYKSFFYIIISTSRRSLEPYYLCCSKRNILLVNPIGFPKYELEKNMVIDTYMYQ